MTAAALVHGKLVRDPQRKTSKSGKPFTSALLKEGDGESATWWSLLAFNESAIEELSTLQASDNLAVSGSFRAEIFEKGETRRVSFSLFVDRVVSLRHQKRERQSRQTDERQGQSYADRFDDGVA